MLRRLKAWLLDKPKPGPKTIWSDAELACAALLVEAARLDGHYSALERRTILRLIERRFTLKEEEAESLLTAAETLQGRSNEEFKLALTARNAFSEEERVGLIEMLWTTILSDGAVHDYEGNLMRRIAGLLHVPDRAAGEAR